MNEHELLVIDGQAHQVENWCEYSFRLSASRQGCGVIRLISRVGASEHVIGTWLEMGGPSWRNADLVDAMTMMESHVRESLLVGRQGSLTPPEAR